MVSARKTCRKTRFDNEFEAVKWLKRMTHHVEKSNMNVMDQYIPTRVYECPTCNGYHATSSRRLLWLALISMETVIMSLSAVLLAVIVLFTLVIIMVVLFTVAAAEQ